MEELFTKRLVMCTNKVNSVNFNFKRPVFEVLFLGSDVMMSITEPEPWMSPALMSFHHQATL